MSPPSELFSIMSTPPMIPPTTSAPRGDFAAMGIYDEHSLSMLNDGFRAVSAVPNGWDVLARTDVPGTRACGYCGENRERRFSCRVCNGRGTVECGFMFDTHPDPVVKTTIDKINSTIDSGHSGSSYGWTMRNLESIAKNGWDLYVANSRYSRAKSILENPRLDNQTREEVHRVLDVLHKQRADLQVRKNIEKTVVAAATIDTFINNNRAATPNLTEFANAIQTDPGMRAMIPDIDQQADALKRFASGKMSYAEMRSLCG